MGKVEEPEFAANEKILCFHGPLIYEAKVLKLEKREKEWYYFIHYQGWSKNWDEYVPESRVLKYTDENVKRQKEHEKAVRKTPKSGKAGKPPKALTPGKKSGSGSVTGESTSSTTASTTTDSRPSTPVLEEKSFSKKGKDKSGSGPPSTSEAPSKRAIKEATNQVESEDKFEAKQEIVIPIPERLRVLLVDDWDFISRQKKIVNVPGRHTVDSIFKDFQDSRPDDDNVIDYCRGMTLYFNVMLGSQLLYRFERNQYGDILRQAKEGKTEAEWAEDPTPMSSIYGPIHLLRLYTKIGSAITFTKIRPNEIAVILEESNNFFTYMENKFDDYFNLAEDYTMSDPVYQRKAPV